jgi:hypothetical protein
MFRRIRPRFRLRTAFAFTGLLALLLAWWVDHHRLIVRNDELVSEIKQMRRQAMDRQYEYQRLAQRYIRMKHASQE